MTTANTKAFKNGLFYLQNFFLYSLLAVSTSTLAVPLDSGSSALVAESDEFDSGSSLD